MMVPSIAASDRAKLRFQRELDVLKNLRHPNIVAFHTMFELDGQFQLVMEYVVGKDAHEWVKSLPGPLSAAAGGPDRRAADDGARPRPREGLRPPRHQALEPARHRARRPGRRSSSPTSAWPRASATTPGSPA